MVQLLATAFDNEWFRHLPYIDISSSGGNLPLWSLHIRVKQAQHMTSTRRARPVFPRSRCEFAHTLGVVIYAGQKFLLI